MCDTDFIDCIQLYLTDKDTFQILSRAKPALGTNTSAQVTAGTNKKALPKLEDFLKKRDFTGAITLLEVKLYY